MPTRWETFPVELREGLVSNIPRLQQGIKLPGSARILENFEPSINGGYRRINGYTKFNDDPVPYLFGAVVVGSGQSGGILEIGNVHSSPSIGDTFTLDGNTYSVTSASFSSSNSSATLGITPDLVLSPSDGDAVDFDNSSSGLIEGVHFMSSTGTVFALRSGQLFKSSSGGSWSQVNIVDFGSVSVIGSGQTGTSLDVLGFTDDTITPSPGDTFSIFGIEGVYTVQTKPTVTGGSTTLTISPSLSASPSSGAALTFLSSSHTGGTKARFHEFNFNGTEKVAMVDGAGYPVILTDTTYTVVDGTTDVFGASHVVEFKDYLFFAKDDLVSVAAPFTENDFDVANGAFNYRMPTPVTGLITFREELINFSEKYIKKLSGDSTSDFRLTTITENIGCIEPDTIQEVGGDVMFMGPDGVRFLGATDRIGDFSLSLASRTIQVEMKDFIKRSGSLCSTVVREKNQYRVFSFEEEEMSENSIGYIAAQYVDQSGQGVRWSSTKGLQVYRATSDYRNEDESILFTNKTGYVYRMESGKDYDGVLIRSRYFSPFMSVNDPNIRKTAFKVHTYFDPEGSFNGTLSIRYDFIAPEKIQPNFLPVGGGGSFAFFGDAVFGSSMFGGEPETVIKQQAVGSFFTISYQYEFDGEGEPFTLDTVLLEYSTNDRK